MIARLLTEQEVIKYCAQLEDCILQDTETGHGNADDILMDVLKAMGYIQIIALYEQVHKWYS